MEGNACPRTTNGLLSRCMEHEPTAEIPNTRGFPFRWVLPVVQLAICFVAVWPARWMLVENLAAMTRRTEETKSSQNTHPAVPVEKLPEGSVAVMLDSDIPKEFSEIRSRLQIPTALNLPASLVQVPYAMLSPDSQIWHPRGTLIQEWNAMFLPFVGMVFWWFAGRGLEGFFSALRKSLVPKISWLEFVFAAAMFLFGIVAVIAIYFSSPSDRKDMLTAASGFALWAALSVPVLFAKILQRRLTKAAAPAAAKANT